MQFGLCAVLVLILMDIADSNKVVKGRRHKRRSTEVSLVCSKGCELCSEFNGCIKCSPKFFFLLERNDIRQLGVCLLSCPVGYFDVRNREINKCMKCKINNCETCFSKDFCTKCNEGFYKHKRNCYSTCPDGTVADNSTMECSPALQGPSLEEVPNTVLHIPAQCEMSEWGAWSPCSRKKKCGKKRGNEERSRKVLQAPLGDISVCPLTTERRICIMPKVQCPKGEKKKKGAGNKQKNKNRDKNIEDPGNKKRKGQLRVTSMPITPSIPAQ